MKTINLESAIQNKRAYDKSHPSVIAGQASRNWPLCATCGRDVDAAYLENANNTSCEIRAKCHGKEEAVKVVWGELKMMNQSGDILEDWNVGWAINRALRDTVFFSPDYNFDFSSKR